MSPQQGFATDTKEPLLRGSGVPPLGVCGGESFSQSQTDALLMKRINGNTHQVLLSSVGKQLPYYVTYNLGLSYSRTLFNFKMFFFKKKKNFNIRPNKFIRLKFLSTTSSILKKVTKFLRLGSPRL